MEKWIMKIIQCIVVLCFMGAASIYAQHDSKEIRTMKLQIKEATLQLSESETSLKKAEDDYKEGQALFDKGLYNKIELAQSEETFHNARLRYQQATIDLEKTRLAFLNHALYIALDKAVLYRDKDGYKHALLTIKNSSNVGKIIDEDGTYSDTVKQALLGIDNLTVRILKDGTLIGRPFEYKVNSLAYQQTRNIDFTLQRETEELTVELAYADTIVHLPVFLEKEAREDRILIEATQFSQEGELGTAVTYDLSLERFADEEAAFSIEPLNLPDRYQHEFREISSDHGSGNEESSRISRIRFKQGVTTKLLQLTIDMPKEIPKEELTQKISFYVLVMDRFAQQRLADMKARLQGRAMHNEDLDSAKLSYENLELIPQGRAEVDIVVSNLYKKVKIGEPINFSFVLYNKGTVALDQIRLNLGLPLDWTANVKPEKDISLDVEAKCQIEVEVIPASGVAPGEYPLKLDAKTLHEGRDVDATSQNMRIEIEGKSNILIGAILMILLIGMIVGVAVMTIKISRR